MALGAGDISSSSTSTSPLLLTGTEPNSRSSTDPDGTAAAQPWIVAAHAGQTAPDASSSSSSSPSSSTAARSLTSTALPQAAAAAAAAASALGLSSAYVLPAVESVAGLWVEWSAGRGGRMALKEMDQAKDLRLRTSSGIRQQVYRWRKIATFIEEFDPATPSSTVAERLDAALKVRKGGLRLLAEELAKEGGKDKWRELVQPSE